MFCYESVPVMGSQSSELLDQCPNPSCHCARSLGSARKDSQCLQRVNPDGSCLSVSYLGQRRM
ncbi:hypothetical protein M378DRAFT_674490 [Amanita muscaria Koide BX008]|uniref:Uncharacterized protein n=1 Tax=Amanita muscaria (strain Koide BX008) TaxID=946122 RepID=A0A0C2X2C8_AMAMK|nr:hypothetical protein M378DRAFT_674490 [Amanita muscaria Koide BX008]